jgi:hypothetical protein
MKFVDLYHLVEAKAEYPVRFEMLRELVQAHHRDIGRVDVLKIEYPEPIRDAHYILGERDRTSPHDDDFAVAEIRYCSDLDNHPYAKRYIITKELMHVFDSNEQRTDSREKFLGLIREIQNKPMSQHASEMYRSEMYTKWMALLILCPMTRRTEIVGLISKGEISVIEISSMLAIPESAVNSLLDEYYEVAHKFLVEGEH